MLDQVMISGDNGPGNFVWEWNPGALSGNQVMVSPPVTTVYTVTATDTVSGCSSTDSVTVNVIQLPSAPVATNSVQCGYGVPEASVVSSGGMLNWYLVPTGGTPLPGENGLSLSNYAINETTTFYVSEFDGTCEGPRSAATATVTPSDSVSISVSSPACANSSITLTAVQHDSNNNFTYEWTATPETGSGITGTVTGQQVIIVPDAAGEYTYT